MILQTSLIFNNYFAPTAETTRKSMTYSLKHITNEDGSTTFLQPTDKEKIVQIVSSLLKNKISKQLADIINLSFMACVFPWVLKTAQVVPVFKKDWKSDYTIALLSNIEKTLEKIMYKRFCTFLNHNNIIYNIQFGSKQQYSASHALVSIAENIRKARDDGNIDCGVFIDLKKLLVTIRYCLQNWITMGFVKF